MSVSQGLSVSVRLGEVDTIEYQRDRGLGRHRVLRQAQGLGQHGGSRPGRGAADGGEGLRDRALHDGGSLRGADRCRRRSRARSPISTSIIPGSSTPERAIELARECEAAGLAVDARVTQLRGRGRQHPAPHRVYGNSLGFLAGYSAHQPLAELLAARPAGRGHAARLLVHARARPARPRGGRERSAARAGRAGARAPGRAAAADAEGPGRCSRPTWRADCSATSSARSAARASTASPRSCWTRPASRCSRRSSDAGAAAHQQGTREQPLRRTRASRRATATWCATGVLEGYVLGSYSARKLGLKTTGNAGGVHNLLVAAPGRRHDFARASRAHGHAACSSPS